MLWGFFFLTRFVVACRRVINNTVKIVLTIKSHRFSRAVSQYQRRRRVHTVRKMFSKFLRIKLSANKHRVHLYEQRTRTIFNGALLSIKRLIQIRYFQLNNKKLKKPPHRFYFGICFFFRHIIIVYYVVFVFWFTISNTAIVHYSVS